MNNPKYLRLKHHKQDGNLPYGMDVTDDVIDVNTLNDSLIFDISYDVTYVQPEWDKNDKSRERSLCKVVW